MTAVFSAEYAAELVQRARDGATFAEVTLQSWHRVEDRDLGAWLPAIWHVRSAYRYLGQEHWVAWYREAFNADLLLWEIAKSKWDTGKDVAPWIADENERAQVRACRNEMFRNMWNFEDSVNALGSLCQLPAEWTIEHREEARKIGSG